MTTHPDTPARKCPSDSAVRARQAPLRALYRQDAATARIVDRASINSTRLEDPLQGRVQFGTHATAEVDFAVHQALGGLHQAPVPGDLLCAALAACQESSLRMVANLFGVQLEALSVQVEADVDVRGTLGMDPGVPVGFQAMRVAVQLCATAGTSDVLLGRMCKAAERACVVLQTLRAGVPVAVAFQTSIADASVASTAMLPAGGCPPTETLGDGCP